MQNQQFNTFKNHLFSVIIIIIVLTNYGELFKKLEN